MIMKFIKQLAAALVRQAERVIESTVRRVVQSRFQSITTHFLTSVQKMHLP